MKNKPEITAKHTLRVQLLTKDLVRRGRRNFPGCKNKLVGQFQAELETKARRNTTNRVIGNWIGRDDTYLRWQMKGNHILK